MLKDKTDLLLDKMKEEFHFFKTLSDKEISDFLHFCEFRRAPAGGNLWQEGDGDNYAAFIVSGKLGIKKKTVTAVVLEDVEIVILRSHDFERLITEYPMLGLKLLRHIFLVMSKRLSRSTERIASIF